MRLAITFQVQQENYWDHNSSKKRILCGIVYMAVVAIARQHASDLSNPAPIELGRITVALVSATKQLLHELFDYDFIKLCSIG